MRQVICKIVGHQLRAIHKDNILLKEYECKNCKTQFTLNGYGKLVKLNDYWRNNNLLFEK